MIPRYVISANLIIEANDEQHARQLADDILHCVIVARYPTMRGWDNPEVSIVDVFAEDVDTRMTDNTKPQAGQGLSSCEPTSTKLKGDTMTYEPNDVDVNVAESLSPDALAHRIGMMADDVIARHHSFNTSERVAFLREAARRLHNAQAQA